VYPTGCSVGQANLDGPWPRQNVLERKRRFYPRLYIPVHGNYDRPTWYGIKLKIEEKVVHIAQSNQKRGMKEKSVNREKPSMCIMPLPHTFIYSAFRRTFHDAN
jgi:hypothetical protein